MNTMGIRSSTEREAHSSLFPFCLHVWCTSPHLPHPQPPQHAPPSLPTSLHPHAPSLPTVSLTVISSPLALESRHSYVTLCFLKKFSLSRPLCVRGETVDNGRKRKFVLPSLGETIKVRHVTVPLSRVVSLAIFLVRLSEFSLP